MAGSFERPAIKSERPIDFQVKFMLPFFIDCIKELQENTIKLAERAVIYPNLATFHEKILF